MLQVQEVKGVLAGAEMRFPFPTFQAARAAYGEQLAALTGGQSVAAA